MTSICCLCRSNRSNRNEQYSVGDIVRKCGLCQESDMSLRKKPVFSDNLFSGQCCYKNLHGSYLDSSVGHCRFSVFLLVLYAKIVKGSELDVAQPNGFHTIVCIIYFCISINASCVNMFSFYLDVICLLRCENFKLSYFLPCVIHGSSS